MGDRGPRDARPSSDGRVAVLESLLWQTLAVVIATAGVAAWHWSNDGLWFQGDAPRHAMNGLFVGDLLTALPRHPLSYALSYYARYPVIAPIAYPPLFYLLEAIVFRVIAPSPYLAKALVLLFLLLLGIYTMRWGRAWIGTVAGWAGVAVVLLPGSVRYSNAVLLNVPSVAVGVAALYHLHRWLDHADVKESRLFSALAMTAVVLYYPGAIVLPVAIIWLVCSARFSGSWSLWLLPAAIVVIGLLSTLLLPVHVARHAPSIWRLLREANWMFYVREIRNILGVPWLVLGLLGVLGGLLSRSRRREAVLLLAGSVAVVVSLVLLPSMSDRYALILGPMVVLAGFLGLAGVIDVMGNWRPAAVLAVVVVVFGYGGATAAAVRVPEVSGMAAVADYLRDQGPSDSVLYSGRYDGVFGFYVRASDPDFKRRVVLSNKLLYRYEQNEKFIWIETPHVSSPADVVTLIAGQCGCRWIAVEVGATDLNTSEWHLRHALEGPEFTKAASFPIQARAIERIDVYRVQMPIQPAAPADLIFPSFSARVFSGVEPIASRR